MHSGFSDHFLLRRVPSLYNINSRRDFSRSLVIGNYTLHLLTTLQVPPKKLFPIQVKSSSSTGFIRVIFLYKPAELPISSSYIIYPALISYILFLYPISSSYILLYIQLTLICSDSNIFDQHHADYIHCRRSIVVFLKKNNKKKGWEDRNPQGLPSNNHQSDIHLRKTIIFPVNNPQRSLCTPFKMIIVLLSSTA